MWSIQFKPTALKHLKKLDRQTQEAINAYLDQLATVHDPENFGKPLLGNLFGLWRYRVGKYRIICELQKTVLIVEVIEIGKRDKVYR